MMNNLMFAPPEFETITEEPKYDHGFTPEQVEEIINKKKELEEKLEKGIAATLDEFKTVIVPYQRIIRANAFNLNPVKEAKPKTERVKKEKVVKERRLSIVKEKKLTKAQITIKMNELIMKMMISSLTIEEEDFYNQHISPLL